MPGILTKISDYDRLERDLQEARKAIEGLQKELEGVKADLGATKRQLDRANQKVKEERRRRTQEESRRGKAERDLAEAERRLEAVRARILELEMESDFGAAAILDREAQLDPGEVMAFVNEVGFTLDGECLSARVPPEGVHSLLERLPGMSTWASRLSRSERGLLAFACGQKGCLLQPPMPVEEERITGGGLDFSLLDPLLEQRTVGLISIHHDLYAVCTVSDHVEESIYEEKDVVGKSKKGGFSQARYSRSRDDQFKHLLGEAIEGASRIFSEADPALVFVEGDERAMAAVAAEADPGWRLARLSIQEKMSRDALERMPEIIWKWTGWVFELPEPLPSQSDTRSS